MTRRPTVAAAAAAAFVHPHSPRMAIITKILLAAAVLCFLAWGAVLVLGLQPLTPATGIQVVYGEQEDFFSDAVVYRRHGNGALYLIHAPRARTAYRWWVVDFREPMIRLVGPPRSAWSRKFVMRNDLVGTYVTDGAVLGDWNWHFTEEGAAFSGNGFTCSVRKTRSN